MFMIQVIAALLHMLAGSRWDVLLRNEGKPETAQ